MNKKDLILGSWVKTAHGFGKVRELREDRAHIKVTGDKTLRSFAYKDLNGITLTTDFIEDTLGITEKPNESQVKNLNLERNAYILAGSLDYLYILWEGIYTRQNDLHWNLGLVLLDSLDPTENRLIRTFAWDIKYLHQLQVLSGIIPELNMNLSKIKL